MTFTAARFNRDGFLLIDSPSSDPVNGSHTYLAVSVLTQASHGLVLWMGDVSTCTCRQEETCFTLGALEDILCWYRYIF